MAFGGVDGKAFGVILSIVLQLIITSLCMGSEGSAEEKAPLPTTTLQFTGPLTGPCVGETLPVKFGRKPDIQFSCLSANSFQAKVTGKFKCLYSNSETLLLCDLTSFLVYGTPYMSFLARPIVCVDSVLSLYKYKRAALIDI